tara:strand:+ start:16531 stop:16827 length:297 start_codon:yes stop_codon:yes gene_type:complete
MNKVDNFGKLKAFFDLITGDGFIIKGFRLMESIDGNHWVGNPSAKNKDGEYNDTAYCSKGVKDKLQVLANAVYSNPSLIEDSDTKPEQPANDDEVVPF